MTRIIIFLDFIIISLMRVFMLPCTDLPTHIKCWDAKGWEQKQYLLTLKPDKYYCTRVRHIARGNLIKKDTFRRKKINRKLFYDVPEHFWAYVELWKLSHMFSVGYKLQGWLCNKRIWVYFNSSIGCLRITFLKAFIRISDFK